jgi:ribosome-associated protein
VLKVSALTGIADYFMICSGESHRQVQAVADAIDKLLAQAGCSSLSVEGMQHANWVLMDYNDLIVHIFRTETREFYGLDQLWGDAPRLRLSAVQLQQMKATPSRRTPPRGRPSTTPSPRGR